MLLNMLNMTQVLQVMLLVWLLEEREGAASRSYHALIPKSFDRETSQHPRLDSTSEEEEEASKPKRPPGPTRTLPSQNNTRNQRENPQTRTFEAGLQPSTTGRILVA